MASVCKRQQCTIDRRGFRQELDSWRHKLIRCVGRGPEEGSDWSFDENCLFCCLRRDKVKEHLLAFSKEVLEDTAKPLLVKDQTAITRLEKQTEDFLHAVFCRKDVPNVSDPHIPIVAREILQKMIRQFATEYTSKTSSIQDSCPDSKPRSDQSLLPPSSFSGAPPSTSSASSPASSAHKQNPVLSKLLMADQDAPLDLTVKKPLAEPSEQDGVLDLSVKKNRYSSSLSVCSPCISPPASMLKRDSPDLHVAKEKDLQSTSTLEQFMAKLCPHHQRQMVDAISFLQMEVKALASSNTLQAANATTVVQAPACSTAPAIVVNPEKSCPELKLPTETIHKSEAQDMVISVPTNLTDNVPETAVTLKTSIAPGPLLDICKSGSGNKQPSVDTENRQDGHIPLKMKIMKTSNVVDGNKLSCVLTTSLTSNSGTLEERQGNSDSSNKIETLSARLSSSVKRHSQPCFTHPARENDTLGHAKDTPARAFLSHVSVLSGSPRTARKSIKASTDHQTRDSRNRITVDPDLGNCDIVYIDKPITECFREKRRNMFPRRNARKSTRGHLYIEEMWELKTVRTLAGRNERGNCPNPMPELITLVTPKQILSKPDGVPPVDMPFAGSCREKNNQQIPTDDSEGVIPGTGDVVQMAASEADLVVETSQTDQCQSKEQPALTSPISASSERKETDINAELLENSFTDFDHTDGTGENVGQATFEAENVNSPETQDDLHESNEQVIPEQVIDPSENAMQDVESQDLSETVHGGELRQQQTSPLTVVNAEEKVTKEQEAERTEEEQSQEVQPEMQMDCENLTVTETSHTTGGSVDEETVKEAEINAVEAVDSVEPQNEDADEFDVSSKTLDALLKELPPWRRKKGTLLSLPKRFRQTESSVVGYFNGKPISASDRSLRHRTNNSTTPPKKLPVKSSKNESHRVSGDSSGESVKTFESTPLLPLVTEEAPDKSSPVAKSPSKNKQIQKEKKIQTDHDSLSVHPDQPVDCPPSKRHLRSAQHKLEESLVSPLTHVVASFPSPKSPSSDALPSTDHLPSLSFSSSPQSISSPLAGPEQSQVSTAPLTNSSVVEAHSDAQQTEIESRLQAKQKLRSAKVEADASKNGQQLCSEVSYSVENQSPIKTKMETQIMPLRSKRILRKDAEASDLPLQQTTNVTTLEDRSVCGDDSNSFMLSKPTRMPLRSMSGKAEIPLQSLPQSPPLDSKKLSLRSQKLVMSSDSGVAENLSDTASAAKSVSEKMSKTKVKPPTVTSVTSHNSAIPVTTSRAGPQKQTADKFLELLNREENQNLIANLNSKYDKMQKGWVQIDKEGQPATKHKNKADRQAVIWKTKRRARKQKSPDHKYSPVQMLFMTSFDLSSICRWFLESTETKSLVIVKKVNTRLPPETQMCFHSTSGVSGMSQGVFPSLQAERLKKHLKKFAIASPVKSNPKSQKLIAKALEQESNAVKAKERREPSNSDRSSAKSCSSFAESNVQVGEYQKSSSKSKNPASARILRKYSHIREKMQVQQTKARLKRSSKTLKATNVKTLSATKSGSKSNPKRSLKAKKLSLSVSKRMKESTEKAKKKPLTGKTTTVHPVQEKARKAQSSSKVSKALSKIQLPKRCSQRLGSPKMSRQNIAVTSRNKMDKKRYHTAKAEVEKCAASKGHAIKSTKESSKSPAADERNTENATANAQQGANTKAQMSNDQVLTRSQRKMETCVSLSENPSSTLKKSTKSPTAKNRPLKPVGKSKEPATRQATSKSLPKKHQAAAVSQTTPRKLSKKRAQECLDSPAKRTRTSLAK
ncbi:uncharacterized protein wu:fc17b08 isoform X2 [Thalassophryne amazonica]|uniref:uncharacterized protein wu:fc17b08 isoform X2 n=1 Tax=Thalassophryne amazonica TaxID=390379 RepID=UPI001470DE25|nr:uncharacterized protein wu:fc17b08 isoform X2 [Thalassophryne amazonica]